MAKLVFFLPDCSTRDFALSHERMTIGRRPDNDICLPNLAVSGEHAAVVTILADSFLEDLGSTNGTLVNGKTITKHFLRERDEVDVGRHRLVYFADDAAAAPIDAVGGSYRSATGDLGRTVEKAEPVVSAKPTPAAARPSVAHASAKTDASPMAPASKPTRVNDDGYVDATTRLHVNTAVEATAPVAPPGVAIASVKVVTGPQAGRSIALTKSETTIGRAGLQVALIVQTGVSFRLRPVEGEQPPTVNGIVVGGDGVPLTTGDAIDIAGSRLEFVGSAP